ncbi:hypothetical protein LV457_19515 [Mycobacterium sp. MYCO198283]|uniref:CDGP domain-containing protein n=1 Tax=Mycobacterium sp. MYCO198283 TaxID=2883505 RepID=UPI001E522651|nr:hypothetical protein [Mycobacterium sp. MYCO198283]MCG5434464.1 hypothetical protein [Mycobacterium sp. MYCO198283]
MKALITFAVSAVAASGIAIAGAAPASAGCQGGWTPWGGGTTCDGPIASDGTFQRCVTAGAMGFGGTNCQLLNINDMAGQPVPYVGP